MVINGKGPDTENGLTRVIWVLYHSHVHFFFVVVFAGGMITYVLLVKGIHYAYT
jgi:hypothetical protein